MVTRGQCIFVLALNLAPFGTSDAPLLIKFLRAGIYLIKKPLLHRRPPAPPGWCLCRPTQRDEQEDWRGKNEAALALRLAGPHGSTFMMPVESRGERLPVMAGHAGVALWSTSIDSTSATNTTTGDGAVHPRAGRRSGYGAALALKPVGPPGRRSDAGGERG